MNKPLVSIGIPTYNRADRYLKYAIQSALNQTYPEIEIIVSDNCSVDNTTQVIEGFGDSRIRYFRQESNIGPINNSNYCLSKANGSYFMQLHDDDMIDDDFVDACMRAGGYSDDLGIIRTGTRVIDSDNHVLQEELNNAADMSVIDFFRCYFSFKTSVYLCSTLYNTARLREYGGFQQSLFDDVIAIVHLVKYGMADVRDAKASFRKHAEEMTFAVDIIDWCRDSLSLLEMICGLFEGQESKLIRDEGMKYYAMINYGFARGIDSRVMRIRSYFDIYRMFDYRHLPPPVINAIYGNPVYQMLRYVKRAFVSAH